MRTSWALWACVPALTLIGATQAAADVTSAQVWDDILSRLQAQGVTVSIGLEEAVSGGLILHEVAYRIDQNRVSAAVIIDQMRLRDRGDGGVDLIFAQAPVALSLRPDNGDPIELVAMMTFTGQDIVYSGVPGALQVDWMAERVEVVLQSLSVAGEAVEIDQSLALEAIAAHSRFGQNASGDLTAINDGTLGALIFAIALKDDDQATNIRARVRVDDYVFQSSGVISDLSQDPTAKPAEGESHASFGAVQARIDTETNGQTILIDIAATSGFSQSEVGDGRMSYSGGLTGGTYRLSGTALPMGPVDFSLDASRFALDGPTDDGETGQPFALKIEYENLRLGEAVWSRFDPGAALPREPANLRVSLSGLVEVSKMPSEPALGADRMAPPPLLFTFLEIEDFHVSLLGVEITARGQFDIDNSAAKTFAGPPRPEGFVDISVRGLGALLTGLTKAGLLPGAQAGMAQMMFGLFATPGADPDTLESRIEITASGEITANGQRVR